MVRSVRKLSSKNCAKSDPVKYPATAKAVAKLQQELWRFVMGKNSKIEWCDHTFTPWIGCQKVSPGCDHCYAEKAMDHRFKKVQWGPHSKRIRTSEENWKK